MDLSKIRVRVPSHKLTVRLESRVLIQSDTPIQHSTSRTLLVALKLEPTAFVDTTIADDTF